MTNLHTKYEVPGYKHSLVIEQKPFLSLRSLSTCRFLPEGNLDL